MEHKMSTTTFSIQMDEALKKDFEAIATSIGLSPNVIFNVFARQFVAHRGFPFSETGPVPNEKEFTEEMDGIYLSMANGQSGEHELAEI